MQPKIKGTTSTIIKSLLTKTFNSRIAEIETELNRLRLEYDSIRNRIQLSDSGAAIISSVAKVVQPTATVSSVPVSGPSKFNPQQKQHFLKLDFGVCTSV